MAKQDFVSGRQADRINNGREFVKQLGVDGTNFGLANQEVQVATDAFNVFEDEFKKGIGIDALKQEQTKTTKGKDDFFVTLWRKYAGRIKESANYKEGVGERYKIVGDEQTIDIDNSKPGLKAKRAGNGWEMAFNLKDFFDGVHIYRKKPGQNAFTKIAYDTSSPYVDTDTMQNGTEYYAVYVIDEKEVGLPGDVLTIAV